MTRARSLWSAARHPRTTVRWRLTALYAGLFLVCGAGLLAVTYALVQGSGRTIPGPPFVHHVQSVASRPATGVPPAHGAVAEFQTVAPGHASGPIFEAGKVPPALERLLQSNAGRLVITVAGATQRGSDLHQLEIKSAIALAIMTILSAALGWVVAGRVLAPLRTMTDTTREISERNLHRRLAVAGPPDELRTLGDTIDGLLARLEGAFDAQRRFVANASHELRTPLAASRALLEMVMTDPHATVADFRRATSEALEESDRSQQLIDALLVLAQGQRGLETRTPVRLDPIAETVLDAAAADAIVRELQVERSVTPATLDGDPRLVERLVANLVANAIVHNAPGGIVQVTVDSIGGATTLRVVNSGPAVPADQLARLLAPFARLHDERVGQPEGLGLGLSIVATIAKAHDAALTLRSRPEGGLAVEVTFPAPGAQPDAGPVSVAMNASERPR